MNLLTLERHLSPQRCSANRRYRFGAAVVLALLLLGPAGPPPAAAQTDGEAPGDTASDEDAGETSEDGTTRRTMEDLSSSEKSRLAGLLKSARAAYSEGRFDAVVPLMREAHRLLPNPAFVYRIALSYERGGHPKKALETYERYLQEKPNTQKRGQVEKTIANLREEIEEQEATGDNEAEPPPETKVEPPGKVADRPAADGPRPLPLGFAIGGGVATAASLTFGIVFGSADRQYNQILADSRSQPRGATDIAATARRRNTFLGLTYASAGLAVAGFGTATVLWLTGPDGTDASARAPTGLSLRLVPSPGYLGVAGRF